MVRIVGILCGSAISVTVLIMALGVPEFIRQPKTTVEPAVETVAEPAVEVFEEPLIEPTIEPIIEPIIEPVIEPTIETAVESPAPQPQTEHWYAFWSPFRSELAANGFVSQLQRSTGMDYRVVRLKPGVYEVAFLYDGEDDIETKLVAISAATGLEMADE
jgi:hypothetical protein